MKRVVALKVLPQQAVNSPKAVQRFYQEVEVAAKLAHPNIVTAHDAGEAHGMHFLVMEYVEGRDLSSHVKTHGPLGVEQAMNVAGEMTFAADRYDGRMQMTMGEGGQSMAMSQTYAGRRVGNCTASK